MRTALVIACLMLLTPPATAGQPNERARLRRLATRIAGSIDCSAQSADVFRHVCALLPGLKRGEPLGRHARTGVYAGVSVFFHAQKPVKHAMRTRSSLSALALRRKKGQLLTRVTELRPTSAIVRGELARVALGLALLLKGHVGNHPPLSPDLRRYLRALSAHATYPVTRATRRYSQFYSTVSKMAGRIYTLKGVLDPKERVVYMVVEFALDGIHLSFYPVR